MIRAAARLAVIFLLVAGGVRLGYIQLEKKLLNSPCLPLQSGGLAGRPEEAEGEEESAAEAVAEEPSGELDFQVIVQRNIFQTVQAPFSASAPAEEHAAAVEVPTSLKLVLAGTVVGTDETSRAIVVDNAKKDKAQLVRIGEQIQGATVKSIEWNKVVLDVNGTEETLSMPDAKSDMSGRPKRAAAPHLGLETEAVEETFVEEGGDSQPSQPPARPNRRVSLPPGREAEDAVIEEEVELPEIEDGGAVPAEEPPPEEQLQEETTVD